MTTNTKRLCYIALRAGQLLAQDLIEFSHEEECDGSLLDFFQRAVNEYAELEETEYRDVPFDTFAEQALLDNYPPMETVCIYADQTGKYTEEECDRDNLVDIVIPRRLLRDWFDVKFATDLSDEIGFDEWLDLYDADDTDGLYDFCIQHGFTPTKFYRYDWFRT